MATRTSLPGYLAAATLASFAVHTGLLVNSVEGELWREQGQNGRLLARQLAEAAAPAVLAQDMVSLSVLLGRYEGQPGISSVRLYNGRKELLTQHGQDSHDERQFIIPLQVQDQSLGHMDLRLTTPARGDVLRRNAGNIGLSALLHLGLLGLLLGLSRRPAATQPLAPQPGQPTSPAPQAVALLHLTLDDPNQLLLRVNASTADELLTVLDHLLDRAARLYGGEVLAPFSPEGTVVRFSQSSDEERSQQAVLCGQLFLQLASLAQEQRRHANLFSLPVKAGLHHAPADDDSNRRTAQLLALTAPSGLLLTSTQALGDGALSYCQTGQPLSLALGQGRELPITVIEKLQPEYQQLVYNQSLQLLTPQ